MQINKSIGAKQARHLYNIKFLDPLYLFKGELAQGTIWAYFGSIIYLSLGMYLFHILPLYKVLVKIRMKIGES